MEGSTIASALVTGATSMVSDIQGGVIDVIPVVFPIFAIVTIIGVVLGVIRKFRGR